MRAGGTEILSDSAGAYKLAAQYTYLPEKLPQKPGKSPASKTDEKADTSPPQYVSLSLSLSSSYINRYGLSATT
jgi:hypothetical protein